MAKKKTICLNMIVKNEALTIERCLDSVTPYISSWCIVDTGSTDGTQDKIRDLMKNKYKIEGELHERPWQDYGTNRSEAIQLAQGKADYLLVIDADDVMVVNDPTAFDALEADAYKLKINLGGISYYRTQIFKCAPEWKYKGVLHEFLAYPEGVTEAHLETVEMNATVSGETREIKGKDKYYADALLFERALLTMNKEEDPDLFSRYFFYLAQSYRDANMMERAVQAYTKRAELGGWPEEVYVSLYMIAKMKHASGAPEQEVIDAYMKAWEYRPVRLEAVYNLIRFLISKERFLYAYALTNAAMKVGPCQDILFLEEDIWRWRLVNDYNILNFQVGAYQEALDSCQKLVDSPYFSEIPKEDQEGILKNLALYKETLKGDSQTTEQEPASSVSAQDIPVQENSNS